VAEIWERATWNASDVPLLLSAEQEHALWVQIIAGSSDASPLVLDALADLAHDACTLLHEYQVGLPALQRAAEPRVDWEKFSEWAEKFQRRLAKAQWLTQAELAGELQRRLTAGEWTAPPELIMWGFDAFTPAQESLLQCVAQISKVSRVEASNSLPSISAESVRSLAMPSRADEFRAAAHWAALRLQKNPASRLAIITTKAADDRGALQRALSLELAPEQFAFALGRPLNHFALVRNALLLLRFQRDWLTATQISDVLRAPQLTTSPDERSQRALFEANVFRRRDVADPTMDLVAFTRWLRGAASAPRFASLGKLLRQCEAALRLLPKANARLGAEDWAEHFSQTLAAFDYPANAQSSVDYQTWERWQQVLQSFSATSISGEMLAHSEALKRLSSMASKIIFQAESGDAPVQIMGPLEAAGSLFDGVFFAGCTDDRWPLAAQLNPLLPVPLQRAAGIPAAVPGETLARATRMTERILKSAPEVLFSHAERDKDGELRPSPVLARLTITQAGDAFRKELCPAVARATPVFDEIEDTFGPRWPPLGPTLSTAALRSQAACPFQAFALCRLHARGEDLPEEGLDAMQRGSLLHEALRTLWSGPHGLQNSEALHTLIDGGGLETFVKQCVEEALPAAADGWQREYFQIERDRLSALICDWLLKVEAKRLPFTVVEAEQEHTLELIESLKFRVRLDRVDALIPSENFGAPSKSGAPSYADSSRRVGAEDAPPLYETVLLDYKTGRLSNKEWNTPRMDEPQLPLYALYALAQPPAAIAIGKIRGGEEPCIKGAASRPEILPGKQKISTATEYQACLAEWQADLEMLAKEFVAGNAAVAPKYGDLTCNYCTLQPLCRVHETDSLLAQSDSDNTSSEASND
jgi:ATP-dependent helicase/nuclease subunit B